MPKHSIKALAEQWILDANTPYQDDERETDNIQWTTVVGKNAARRRRKSMVASQKQSTFKKEKYRLKVCKHGSACHFAKTGSCYFWHPSREEKVCKTLCSKVNCKDTTCLYTHLPKLTHKKSKSVCWYGSRCLRQACPFMHVGDNVRAAVYNLPGAKAYTKKCRYGGDCVNDMCFFAHSRKELRDSHRRKEFKEVPSLDLSSDSEMTKKEVPSLDKSSESEMTKLREKEVPPHASGKTTNLNIVNGFQCTAGQFISTAHNQTVEPDFVLDPDIAVYQKTGTPAPVRVIKHLTKGIIKVGNLVTTGSGYATPVVCSTGQAELKMFEGRTLLMYSFLPTEMGTCGTPVYMDGQIIGLHVISNASGPIKSNFAIPVGSIDQRIVEREVQGQLQIVGKLQSDVKREDSAPSQEPDVLSSLATLPSLITEVGGAVSGLSAAASGIAGIFDTPAIIPPTPQQIYTSDLPREVYTVGFKKDDYVGDQSDCVSSASMMGTSFRERCMIPSRIGVNEWTTTQVDGTLLASYPVSPMLSENFLTIGSYDYYDTTMLAGAAVNYTYWRGAIRFHIEAFPTSFHQGQLYVCFNPNPQPDTINFRECWTLGGVSIDLSVSNSTTYEIPYVFPKDYCHVHDVVHDEDFLNASNQTKNTCCTGYVYIFVQNRLIASSDKVPDRIDVNVSISGGADFDCKVPTRIYHDQSYYARGVWQHYTIDPENVTPDDELEDDQGNSNNNSNREGSTFMKVKTNVPAYYQAKTSEDVSVIGSVPTATTENIFQDYYLVDNGVVISKTQPRGTKVASCSLPGCFFLVENAPSGIANYHALYRSDFQVKLKLSTTQFQCGCARLVFEPIQGILDNLSVPAGTDLGTWASFNASSQLPHADINFNGQTECEFIIPWASVCRAIAKMDSAQQNPSEIGVISIYVWNQLRTTGSASIYGSLWIKAIDPYFSVRRIAGVLQGEDPPASSEQRTVNVSALDNRSSGVEKYYVNDHFSPIELMRRLDYRTSQLIECNEKRQSRVNPGMNPMDLYYAMKIPLDGGFSNTFIESMYAFNSGSKRLTLITNLTPLHPVLFWVKYEYWESRVNQIFHSDFRYNAATAKTNPNVIRARRQRINSHFGQPCVVYQPAHTPIKTIEFPQYLGIPIIQSHGVVKSYQYMVAEGEDRGCVHLSYQWNYIHKYRGMTFTVHAATSVGDDYMLYYPQPPPVIRQPKHVANTFDFVEDAGPSCYDRNNHCNILLSGDIEENPGPKDVLMQFNEWGFQFHKPPTITYSQMDGSWYCWIELFLGEERRMFYGVGPSKKIAKRNAVATIPDFSEQASHRSVDEHLVSPDSTASGTKIQEQVLPNFGITDKIVGALSSGARSLFQLLGSALKETLWINLDEHKEFFYDVLKDVAILVMFFDNVVLAHLQGKTIIYKLPLYIMALRKNPLVVHLFNLITRTGEQALTDGYVQKIFRSCIQALGRVIGCEFSDVTVNRAMYDFTRPSITEMGKKFYAYITNLLQRLMANEMPLDQAVATMTKIRTLYNNKREIFTTDLLFKNRLEFMEIYDQVKICQPILEKYGKPGFNFFMKEVNERYTALAKIAIGSGPRCEPVGIMLSGAAGQGKSVFQTILARAMAKYLLPEGERTSDAIDKNIYALRPGEIEYMDGYCMQDVVTVDDALADADYKTVIPFIQLISTAPTPVAMADLADKGRYFTSKALVISSNFETVQGYNEIKYPEAINRRFELCYHIVCIKPRDNKLDIESLLSDFSNQGVKVWDVLDEHMAFHKYNFGETAYIKKFMKPSEVYRECMNRLKTKINTFGNFESLYSRLDVEDFNNSAESRICDKCETIHDFGCPLDDEIESLYDVTVLDQLHAAYQRGELEKVLADQNYKKVKVPLDISLMSDEESIYDQLTFAQITDVDVVCTVYWCLLHKYKYGFKEGFKEIQKWICDTVSSFIVFIRKHLTKILTAALAIVSAIGAYYISKKVKLGERLTNLSLYFEEWYAQSQNKKRLGEIIASAPRHQYGAEMLKGLLNGEIKPYKGKTEIPHWAFLEAEAMEECKEAFRKCNMEVDEEESDYWKRVISLLRRAGALDEQSLKEGFRKPPKKIQRREHLADFECHGLTNNCVPLYSSPLEDTVVGYGFLVDNVNLLMPKHYLSAYKYLYLSVGSDQTRQEIYLPNSRSIPGKDLMVVNVPPQQSVRKRVKMFLPKNTLYSEYAGYGHRVVGKLSLTTGEEDSHGVLKLCEIREEGAVVGTEFMSLRVTKETRVGICGTPYMCGSFVMGLHVNGAGFDAGMAIVTREELEEVLFPGFVEYELPECEQYVEENWTGNNVGFKHLGAYYGEQGDLLSTNINMSTEKVHSDMYNPVDFPDEFDVSPKNYEVLFKRANKYGFHQPLGSHTAQETSFAFSLYETLLAGQDRDISLLTDEVILNGDHEIMPIKIDSSAGHWSCISNKKKAFIDVQETPEGNWFTWSDDYYNKKHPVLGKSLFEVIQERINLGEKGIRAESFWVTTLKDELLLKEKVEAGKTRVFEAPPLDTTILFKKYFGSFANWYRHNAGPVLSHTIGVEKEKVWGSLYYHLKRNSDFGIAADYSQFDGTIPPSAFSFFQKVVRLYYEGAPEEEHKVRDVLIHELQHTTQLIGSGLYQSGKGNKSGNYLTDVFNSITNVWAWMTSFHRVFTNELGKMPTLDDWFENVVLFTHGDDCILSLKRVITPQKLLDEIRALGFLITSADKSGEDIKYENVDGLTYLKSGFRRSQGIVWPPMPMATCYREVNWCKRSMRYNSTVRKTQISEGRRFAAYHGKEQLAAFDHAYRKNVHKEIGLLLDPVIPETYDSIEIDVRLKQLMQEMCPDNVFNASYLDCFISLLSCGDIESNPGPLSKKFLLLRDILFEHDFCFSAVPFVIQSHYYETVEDTNFWEWMKNHWWERLCYSWHPKEPLDDGETKEQVMLDAIEAIALGCWEHQVIVVDERLDGRHTMLDTRFDYFTGVTAVIGPYRAISRASELMSLGEPLERQYPLFEYFVRCNLRGIPPSVQHDTMFQHRDKWFRKDRSSFPLPPPKPIQGLTQRFESTLLLGGDIEENPGPFYFSLVEYPDEFVGTPPYYEKLFARAVDNKLHESLITLFFQFICFYFVFHAIGRRIHGEEEWNRVINEACDCFYACLIYICSFFRSDHGRGT
ncbi:hypothetical protein [Wenzhou picorna-like virus 48]|uniref:hypothetical protein n=1 Tax=Wenzhou picorna-like virus 48 TaxID=1923635 RepID=UPI0009097F82|nr:hypothetical protein [Wenzhou picorna-like virus 48]APG76679.1 hypothetical protein [Wenzhou picorna-like virus 48]